MISDVTAVKLRLQQEWGILHGESMHVAQQIDTFLSVDQVENAETRTPAYNTAWLETAGLLPQCRRASAPQRDASYTSRELASWRDSPLRNAKR